MAPRLKRQRNNKRKRKRIVYKARRKRNKQVKRQYPKRKAQHYNKKYSNTIPYQLPSNAPSVGSILKISNPFSDYQRIHSLVRVAGINNEFIGLPINPEDKECVPILFVEHIDMQHFMKHNKIRKLEGLDSGSMILSDVELVIANNTKYVM